MSKKPDAQIIVNRWHEADIGHTVTGHGGQCANLHGHRYRFHFGIKADQGQLDELGMVLDFGVIKDTLCRFIDDHYDHRFLIWEEDPRAAAIMQADNKAVLTSFNPTAENIALNMVVRIAPEILPRGYTLVSLTLNETLKCSATINL